MIDHSFGMLALSFQLLTWCTDSAEDLILFYFSQLMSIKMHITVPLCSKCRKGSKKVFFLT